MKLVFSSLVGMYNETEPEARGLLKGLQSFNILLEKNLAVEGGFKVVIGSARKEPMFPRRFR